MSVITDEAILEATLRKLRAEGNYPRALRLAEAYRQRLSSENKPVAFKDPATLYQYIVLLSRCGRLDDALTVFWGDGLLAFDDIHLGDLLRDSLARHFLSRGKTKAAGAVLLMATSLHELGSANYLLDRLTNSLIPVAQNRVPVGIGIVKDVLGQLENIEYDNESLFAEAKRQAQWLLLLMVASQGDNIQSSITAVIDNDVDRRHQDVASRLFLSGKRTRQKLAWSNLRKEIELGW